MMSKIYLINADTFKDYEDLGVNIKPERLLAFIKKAQDLDLKLFLGHAFYYDLLKKFDTDATGLATLKDTASEAYQNLWNGCDYTDRFGHEITFEGLVPALVYFSFARFVEADSIRYTASGPVTKRLDNSDPLKVSDLMKIVAQHRSVANSHCNEVEKFLFDKRSDYPLWRYNEKNKNSRQPGDRIRGIDRTQFNYPGSYNNGLGTNLNDFII